MNHSRKTYYHIILILLLANLSGCSSMVSSAKQDMANNLASAITNNDDLETVKQGAPAYLLMLESFIEGDPEDTGVLDAAAKLYGAYTGVFVTDDARAKRLSQKALDYALSSICLKNKSACGLQTMPFDKFEAFITKTTIDDVQSLYTVGSSWASWVQNRSGDWNAAAELARVTKVIQRVITLDEKIQSGQAHLYMGILHTLLPPALGGKPELGKTHFERAIELSESKNLIAKVIYAKHYARLVFNQELHDKLLSEVIKAEPRIKGYTLTNMLAQQQARELIESGKDYF